MPAVRASLVLLEVETYEVKHSKPATTDVVEEEGVSKPAQNKLVQAADDVEDVDVTNNRNGKVMFRTLSSAYANTRTCSTIDLTGST